MTVAPHPAEVRKIVVRTFLEFGANQKGLTALDENLIVDQGKCVAQLPHERIVRDVVNRRRYRAIL